MASFIPGGGAPVFGAQPSLSGTGAGFAGGGSVSLADVAGRFALGGVLPAVRLPAVQADLGSLGTSAAQENPRTISSAAGSSSGDRIGVQVGSLTIMNPIAEKPSDSITRASNRLAFLAGRGVA